MGHRGGGASGRATPGNILVVPRRCVCEGDDPTLHGRLESEVQTSFPLDVQVKYVIVREGKQQPGKLAAWVAWVA